MKNFDEQEKFFTKGWVVFGMAMLYCGLGGSAFPSIKAGYRLLNISGSTQIILFAGVRFTMAGLLTIVAGSIFQRKLLLPKRENFLKIIFLGLIRTTLLYSLMYMGLATVSGVKASVLNGTNLIFAMLAACFVFHQEKFTFTKLAGTVLCFSAIILLNIDGSFNIDFSLKGEGLLLLSAVVFGFSDCITKLFSAGENAVALSGWQFLAGGSCLSLIGLVAGGRIQIQNLDSFFILLYLILVSSVTFVLWGTLLKYNPVSKIIGWKAVEPICGAFLSAILLKEYGQLGWQVALALMLVCAGITIINFYGQKK